MPANMMSNLCSKNVPATFSNATDLCIFGKPVVVSNLEKKQLFHLHK